MTDITINRQDTFTRAVKTKDADGNLISASGWTIYFTIRTEVPSTSIDDDTDSDVVVAKQLTGDATGIHTLTVTSTETDVDPGVYVYDFQIKNASGEIYSSSKGNFIINGDVTRTT